MKNYQGRELHYRPSAEELEERKQSTMSRKYEIFIMVVIKQSICFLTGMELE